MGNGGFILLYRKLLDWEWWQDSNTVHVWIYLLLRANYSYAPWRGVDIMRGSLITSIGNIAKDCGLSEQNVRTALKHLKKSKCIDVKVTNKYSIITIYEYDKYQSLIEYNQQANQQETNEQLTISQQETNKQLTTSNKNNKNNKNKDNVINKRFFGENGKKNDCFNIEDEGLIDNSYMLEYEKFNGYADACLNSAGFNMTMITYSEYLNYRKNLSDIRLKFVVEQITGLPEWGSYKYLSAAINKYIETNP